jgi:hypothetical protein
MSILRCERCGTLRYDAIDRQGERVAQAQYVHPSDYKYVGREDSRAELRAWIARAQAKAANPEAQALRRKDPPRLRVVGDE